MIRSCRDKDTEKFAGGESVRRFRSFARVAYRKIKYLMAAGALEDYVSHRETILRLFPAIGMGSIQFASMTNGGYALSGAVPSGGCRLTQGCDFTGRTVSGTIGFSGSWKLGIAKNGDLMLYRQGTKIWVR